LGGNDNTAAMMNYVTITANVSIWFALLHIVFLTDNVMVFMPQ